MNKNDDNKKAAEELFKKIISKKIDCDVNEGKKLKEICNTVDGITIDCSIIHKNRIINYIARILNEYNAIILLFLIVNGYELSNDESPIDCHSLDTYLFILDKIKHAKDMNETFEQLSENLKK